MIKINDYEIEEKIKLIAKEEIKRRVKNLQLIRKFESELNTHFHKYEQELLDLKIRVASLERKGR